MSQVPEVCAPTENSIHSPFVTDAGSAIAVEYLVREVSTVNVPDVIKVLAVKSSVALA